MMFSKGVEEIRASKLNFCIITVERKVFIQNSCLLSADFFFLWFVTKIQGLRCIFTRLKKKNSKEA